MNDRKGDNQRCAAVGAIERADLKEEPGDAAESSKTLKHSGPKGLKKG